MTDKHVLVSCPLIFDSIEEFDDAFEEHGVTYDVADIDQRLTEADLLDIIDQYHGVLAGDDEFTPAVFEQADRLDVISKWGIGTDSIDADAAERHGVSVYNTPGAFDREVADVVIGYAIMLTRDLHRIDSAVRDGDWYCPRGRSLHGKTLGVVGVGNIGSQVARLGHAHGMDVLGHDIEPISDSLQEETAIVNRSREQLFRDADVVSLNCPLTEATEEFVGTYELELLGTDGYLINTARGELVEESALVEALQAGTIAGAALDVFQTEPLPTDSPLTDLENVILGSHNAQNTHSAVESVHERAVDNLLSGLGTDEE